MSKLDAAIHRSLSDGDIKSGCKLIAGVTANVISYRELQHVERLEEILGPSRCVCILYVWASEGGGDNGHWITVHEEGDGIEFFDSLGNTGRSSGAPDSELALVPPESKKELGEDFPYLQRLIRATGKKISYNHTALQAPSAATCGRHVIVRLSKRGLPLSQYVSFLHAGRASPDETVTRITFPVLGK